MPEKTNIPANGNVGKQRILSADISEFNKDMLESLFAPYYDKQTNTSKPAPFISTTKIRLTKAEYKYVKEDVETTLGMLFMNRFILESTGIIEHTGYWNIQLDKKGLGKLNVVVNELMVADIIDTKVFGKFIDRRDQLGFQAAPFLATSISASLIRPMHDVKQRKMELMQEYADDINSSDPTRQIMAMNKIEAELMKMVRQNLKGDYGYDMYASGDGNLDNNYKTINVMRGPVFNDITKRFDIVGASLMDGITKHDIPAFSNSNVAAAYPSAIGTAEAGYTSKIILALLQSEHIDPDPESDCGTTVTIPFTVTDSNKKYVIYRYINDGGKKVLTTMENISNYVGKTIQLYSPQCCLRKAICGKCAGRLYHNLGVTQVGLLTTSITHRLLNLKLKSKHDLSQKAGLIDKKFIFETPNSYYDIQDGCIVNKLAAKIYIPKMFEEFSDFYIEATQASCFGILPVKFFNKDGKEVLSARMTIPAMITFNIYEDIQENADYYILSYNPGSKICSVAIQKTYANCEMFLNQIYIHSKSPQVPYNLMTDMMFRSLEINGTDFDGPSIVYELLARRMCQKNGKPFAFVFGKAPGVDPMSYDKLRYREAVQKAGILQGILFEDISSAINVGLQQTLNGVKPEDTPLEMVIKA